MNERTERLLEILKLEVDWCLNNKQIDETQPPYWENIVKQIGYELTKERINASKD